MEEMKRWYKIRQICGREPLQWFLANHIKPRLPKEEWSQYEALRSHYDERSQLIIFRLEEIAKWIWLQHFFRGLEISNPELYERQRRIGLFFHELDLGNLEEF